jgi:hypothetical protein
MRAVAITKARNHLELARTAIDLLQIEGGFRQFERAWAEVLSQLGRVYNTLEQGAKGCNVSEPWFGGKKKERRSDPLLSYIHHARNTYEHGLDDLTQRRVDAASLHFLPTNEITVGFDMMIDDKGAMHVRNPVVKSPNGGINRVEVVNPQVDLIAIRDRGVVYDPPKMHDGTPIVNVAPTTVANLAVAHLERLLVEASELPSH